MRFTRLVPGIGAIPEPYSYYCDQCGEAVTQVGEWEGGATYWAICPSACFMSPNLCFGEPTGKDIR